MKKTRISLLMPSIIVGFISGLLFLFSNLNAQEVKNQKNVKSSTYTFDEKQVRESLQKEGLSESAIDQWIEKKKSTPIQKNKNNAVHNNSLRAPSAACNELGGENGWGPWVASTGDYALIGNNTNASTIIYNTINVAPTAPRFNLTGGNGIDPCTPGPAAGSPPIPVVAPGFGNTSIQLGDPTVNGNDGGCNSGCVERLSCSLNVTAADTNFIYAYAIIFNFPASGATTTHTGAQVPFAEIYMLDQNGDTVECSHQKYMGDTAGQTIPTPGLYPSTCTGGGGKDAAYKPWTTVGVNLAKYVGQTITINIVNADCSQGGHYCHSYWDFQCPPIKSNSAPFCVGQSTTLCAPSSSLISNTYTYQWYVNTKPPGKTGTWTIIPGATGQCVTVTPVVGDTFAVYVLQPSGCNFWIPFIPEPTEITPNFNFTGTCGSYTFTDQSFVSPVSPTNNVVKWNWQFPGGTPSTATSATTTVTYPPGTYTVTLIVTSTAGCTDTMKQTITVGGFPTAAFNSLPTCLGGNTSLTNGSVFPQGDPITSWSWSMPGGIPSSSTTQNPVTHYNSPGTHSVSLTVTTQAGCIDTIIQQVIVYNPPIANFSGPVSGCAPVCNNYKDMSTCLDGNIVNWAWNFPGGTPSSSSSQNPTNICYNSEGSYGASLMITSNYGCKDTIAITPLVVVHPWPNADFAVAPATAPTTDPIFNFSDLWSAGVTSWSWNFGDNSPIDTTSTDPIHSYSAVATANDFYSFNVCLRVQNQFRCWDTICRPVELLPEFEFYIPNSFTPNGDEHNDVFFGKSRGVKEYEIWLFDRWGNLLWHCTQKGKNTDWDKQGQDGMSSSCRWSGEVENAGADLNGRSGNLAQEDVFVWKVKLKDIFGKSHRYIGHVSIVR